MKRWLGLTLALLVLTAILFSASKLLAPKAKIDSLEGIVSENALFYYSTYNLDEKIKDFQASDFFKQISGSPLFKKLPSSPSLEKLLAKMPLVSDFIKKEIALAIFSLKNMESRKAELADLADYLLLARVEKNKYAGIKKSIADLYLTFSSKEKAHFTKYGGVKITNYKLSKAKISLSYALLSDVVVISNKESIIKESIDLFKKQKNNSLAQNENFRKITQRIKKDGLLWGYANNRIYYQDMLKDYAGRALRPSEASAASLIGSFKKIQPLINLANALGVSSFSLGYDELKYGLILKSYQTFNRTKDTENFISAFMSNEPFDKNTFKLLPWDIVGYYGGNQDLLKYWFALKDFFSAMEEFIKAEMGQGPHSAQYKSAIGKEAGIEQMLEGMYSFFGVNIEKDVLPLLGNNFGVAFDGFRDDFPQVYGFIELKDIRGMRDIMNRAAEHTADNINKFFQLQEEMSKAYAGVERQQPNDIIKSTEEKQYVKLQTVEYAGLPIQSIDVIDFPIAGFSPNYCILDKYIVCTLSPSLTKKIIDIYKNNKDSLSTNFGFEKAQNNILAEYSQIMFMDFPRLVQNIQAAKFFAELTKKIPEKTPEGFSRENMDSILSIISNIDLFTISGRMPDAQTLEYCAYIKIKGL